MGKTSREIGQREGAHGRREARRIDIQLKFGWIDMPRCRSQLPVGYNIYESQGLARISFSCNFTTIEIEFKFSPLR